MFKQYVELPRPVHILCLGTFINRAGTLLIPFLTIYLQRELELGTTFATCAMGAYGLGALVAALVGGHLADRLGRRMVMLTSLFGGAVILLFFGLLTRPWSILAASAGFALVAEMYRPAASAMIADLVSPNRRSHAYGLMYVALNLGFCVGPVVGGILTNYSFKWLFWGDALTASVYALLILLTISETLPQRVPPGGGSEGVDPADLTGSGDDEEVALFAAVKHMLRDGAFVRFCLGSFCVALVYMQALSTLPLHLLNQGIAPDTYGKIIALNGMMIVVLQLPMTSFINRFDRATVMIWGALLTAAGFGLTGLAVTPGHFALTIVVWTLGEIMQAPLSPAIVTDLAPTHLRGRYMGAFTMSFSSAMMIGAPIGGFVLERYGGGGIWGGSFAVALVAALLYGSVRRHLRGPVRTPPGSQANT